MAELIFEIGCEEMPARFVAPAMELLGELAATHLAKQSLLAEGQGSLAVYGTPRRLALAVQGLQGRQEDKEETALGPPKKAAYDAEGKPTKAALGFAKSQGVEVEALSVVDTDKGERLAAVKLMPGRPAAEVLAELLPYLVESLSFPKTMRWGSESFRFARPIHWFLALLDGQVVPFTLSGISSSNRTRGHRFLAPNEIEISGAADYLAKLEAAYVLAAREARAVKVRDEVQAAAESAGGQLVPDEALMAENTDLVEWAAACCGSFDPEFLEVPRPVIISAMREHQRYFALEDEAGELLPNFIAVNNTVPKDMAVVTAGHEKVLRARLADARFFLGEDRKTSRSSTILEDLKRSHLSRQAGHQPMTRWSASPGWPVIWLETPEPGRGRAGAGGARRPFGQVRPGHRDGGRVPLLAGRGGHGVRPARR